MTKDSVVPVAIKPEPGTMARRVRWLREGREILVMFGRRGHTQRAVVVDPRPNDRNQIRVRKWRANSNTWTGVVRVYCQEILEG